MEDLFSHCKIKEKILEYCLPIVIRVFLKMPELNLEELHSWPNKELTLANY